MNQTHWCCQWLNVLSMKSFFFERMRLLGTGRSVPRDRASFEQVEFSSSSFPSLQSLTLFSVSLSLDSQLQFFYFSQTGWTVAAIFGTVYLLSTRYIAIRSLSFSLRGSFMPQAPILCLRTRTTDPWKCRNLAVSLNSVPYASSTRILRSYRWFGTRLRHSSSALFITRSTTRQEEKDGELWQGMNNFSFNWNFSFVRSFFLSRIWLLTRVTLVFMILHDCQFRIWINKLVDVICDEKL